MMTALDTDICYPAILSERALFRIHRILTKDFPALRDEKIEFMRVDVI